MPSTPLPQPPSAVTLNQEARPLPGGAVGVAEPQESTDPLHSSPLAPAPNVAHTDDPPRDADTTNTSTANDPADHRDGWLVSEDGPMKQDREDGEQAVPPVGIAALPEAATGKPSFLARAWTFIKANWFLEGLVCVIAFAAIWPALGKKHGIIRSEYTVSYGVVALIFIISGMSLKTAVLLRSLGAWRMHLVIQVISLGVTPAVGLAVGKLLGLTSFNQVLIKGLIIACATPTTISSNVLMTKQASGNEAGALTNAVIGNILGVLVSPSLIYAYAGALAGSSHLDLGSTLLTLCYTVIIPLIFGQIVQYIFPKLVPTLSKYVSLPIVNSSLLLVLVWSVFCDTFSEHLGGDIDAGSLVGVLFLDLALFCSFSALSFGISRIPVFGFTREDTVAIVMCAATKTVALGIPMINIIYAGSPLIGIISTPLLVYHAEQLVVGSFMVTMMAKWVVAGRFPEPAVTSSPP
ncbi:hypothetical protein HK101_009415 [Irineochytrium annulatum]|nr:hypothetical protein HK101_009415 [Irineochytrium annulatum]